MSNGGRRSRRSAPRWRLSPATPLQARRKSSPATPHKIKLTTREFRPLSSVFAGSRSSVLRGRPLEPYRLPSVFQRPPLAESQGQRVSERECV